MALILKSSAFDNGAEIPARYTCKGKNISPPLNWEAVPEDAHSLVLVVDDPDAPDPKAPKTVWVHWVLYNIPANINSLAEHLTSANLPSGALEGINDWQQLGYGGPCPPIGRHRYFHKLYALDIMLEDLNQPSKIAVEAAMQGHIIAQAELIGTCQK
ncbi:MAG: YbhB/YbcL family Raf kinase inhibitor-like protein [Gammaproteobacteria bacterium]|nr:YbhB/YbcL family Raf kinase inhibitor-like protein [Gammaproteobacteria bacterium]